MILVIGFRRVCPTHLQCHWRISSSAGCCLVRFQSSLLLNISDHHIRRILLRQVLMNIWIFFSMAAVALHVSAPYSRTGFTVVSMIGILMLMARVGEAQMFFIWRKAALALPVLAFTAASAPSPPPPPPPSSSSPLIVNKTS